MLPLKFWIGLRRAIRFKSDYKFSEAAVRQEDLHVRGAGDSVILCGSELIPIRY